MIFPRFDLVEPGTVREACGILEKNENSRLMAGGTDLLVNLKKKEITTDLVVSLSKIPELKSISFSESGLSLGPMASIAEIESSPLIRKHYPVLSDAAAKIGSLQIRNLATVGGNLCSARPAGDTIGPLIAYEAVLEITHGRGTRNESIAEFFKGPGETSVGRNEVLTGISLKPLKPNTASRYIKYTTHSAMEIAMVCVTTMITVENGVCSSARVVLGAVGPTFIQCPAVSEFLARKQITESVAERAGELAAESCQARSSTRASADYRKHIVQVLVKRSLLEADAELKSR